MILRSVGLAGMVVVAVAVSAALTLLPALLSILGPRLDALAVRRVAVGTTATDAGPRLARWVMARPVAVLIPTLGLPAAPRRAVPARPLQRARRDDPAGVGAIAGRVRPPPAAVRGGRVRAAHAGGPDDRTGDVTGEPRRALRLDPPARGRSAHHPGREPRRRRSAADALAVPAALRRRRRSAGSVSPAAAGRDDAWRPHRGHDLHPVRAEPRRGPCARPRPARGSGRARGARRDVGARRRRRGGGDRRRGPDRRRLPAGRRSSSW